LEGVENRQPRNPNRVTNGWQSVAPHTHSQPTCTLSSDCCASRSTRRRRACRIDSASEFARAFM